jgi:MFS family permease
VPRQLGTTLEVDDGIVRIGRARGACRSGSAPLVGAPSGLIHGSYFPDIFIGLLLCGLGIGLAFVTATVAALAGVAGHEAGLASGLSNTALQTGTALGVAIVSTVAVSRSQHYLTANPAANPLAALTQGYQSAFLACAVLAGTGLALALLLPGRPRKPAHELPEPVLATGTHS